MRKNNLVKNLLAAMTLLFASSTMISCQGLVDAVIGSEDNPVTPVVTPIVDASQIIGTREVAVGTTLIPDGVSVTSVTSEVVVARGYEVTILMNASYQQFLTA